MVVGRSLNAVKYDAHTLVSIGTFDGIHRGHQSIINELVNRSKKTGRRNVIVTFDPHPRVIVGKEPVALLMTLEERLEIMEKMGVNVVFIINFNKEFASLSAAEFIQSYIYNGIGAEEIIVGNDHMFGKDRLSGIKELKEMSTKYGFNVIVVDPVFSQGQRISSSKIRHMLSNGDVENASDFLGRPYSLEGMVVEGDKRGFSLGFPTANIEPVNEKKIIPAHGVYFVNITIDDKIFYGMLNVGVRPTFKSDLKRIIEVHIFDFSEILYNKKIRISFLNRLRNEMKFSKENDLINQLKKDKENCILLMNEINK